ncbi:MAG: SusC/RagA family TonB-linked outer membrane protein [Gemmatimonadetes bacterium]|nr:SusC/RagA family TonB-linked outer membrane protein [Gemmatimonadota bacterium]
MKLRNVLLAGLTALLGVGEVHAQTRVLTGSVTDATSGQPISGAAVAVAGSALGTFTAEDGNFAVTVSAGEVALDISMLGYQPSSVTVPAGTNNISVTLRVDVLNLDEIVVTGQATGISRRNLANAVSTVSARDLERVPAASVEQALRGKVAGANIQSNSGAPGGGMQLQLRGVSTILGNHTPLYVVDGVIVSDETIPSGVHTVTVSSSNPVRGGSQDNSANRIADLNPYDIESIEILKGASAAAIYGSKANNGVVIIRTKRGRVGAPQFNVTQRFGFSQLSNKLGLREFTSMEEAVEFFGPQARDHWQAGRFFDHEELLAGHSPPSYETSASVSGGTEDTRYYASGLVKHDGGIIDNTFYNKEALKLNIDQTLGERVSFSLNTNAIHTLAGRGITNNDNRSISYYMTLPSTPSFVDLRAVCADGSRQADIDNCPSGTGTYPRNPFASSNILETASLVQNNEEVWRFVGSGNLTFDAITSSRHTLRLSATGGIDFYNQKNELYSPPESQFEPNDGLPGTSVLGSAYSQYMNGNLNAVYTLNGNSYQSTTSFGTQYEIRDLDASSTIAKNLIGGLQNIDRGTATEVRQNRQRSVDFGIFAQEELLLMDETLLLTAGARVDRSSNNSDTDAFHFYPKLAASYRIPVDQGALSEVKFRGAWGQSGNQPVYGQKFTEYEGRNIGGLPALRVEGTTASLNLSPERQTEIEGGIDATLFDDRATVEFTYFNKNISNVILERSLAPSTGFDESIFNGGEFRVWGLETAITVVPVYNRDLQWTARGTFGMDRSEVVSLPVPRFTVQGFGYFYGTTAVEEGRSLTLLWGNGPNPETGEVGVGPLADANPDFRVGFSNDIRFRQFNIYGTLDWQKGGTANNLTQFLFDLTRNTEDCNNLVGGESVCVQRNREFPNNTGTYFQDASFVKLRELTVSYDLSPDMVSGIWSGARYIRLNMSGRNLLTFTDYAGLDPEVSNFGSEAVGRGQDVAPFPPSRSFWFSVDVGF